MRSVAFVGEVARYHKLQCLPHQVTTSQMVWDGLKRMVFAASAFEICQRVLVVDPHSMPFRKSNFTEQMLLADGPGRSAGLETSAVPDCHEEEKEHYSF